MTSEACREMRASLGAVALGGADPGEALAFRAHLDGCADCRAEFRELTSVAAALPLADPSHLTGGLLQPPKELAGQVLGRVSAERGARRRIKTRRRVAIAAATVTAIAAALLAFVMIGTSSAPAGTRVVFASHNGITADATLHPHAAGTEVAFHVAGLHEGDYYWLWVTGSDGDRIAAGSFQGSGAPANLTMNAALPLSEATRIWVTDEHNHVVLDDRLPASA